MSGIFRYNSNNSTPKRRSTLSPFCTSPGQLQDATMDNAYAFGYRSPSFLPASGGNTSPGQGRSLREHDEQLNALRKENFNLKLRIYFLEENKPSSALSEGTESLYKQNVDLKVETEALRAELKEKQSLLCEAAAALELMEQSQKKSQDDHEANVDELNQKVHFLEMEIKTMDMCQNNSFNEGMGQTTMDPNVHEKMTELEHCVAQYAAKVEEMSQRIKEDEALIAQKDERIKEFAEKGDELNQMVLELKKQLAEKEQTLNNLELNNGTNDFLREHKIQMAEKDCQIQNIQDSYRKGCQTIQYMMSRIKSLEKDLSRLKNDKTTNEDSLEEGNTSTYYLKQIEDLRAELEAAQNETAAANRWRKECGDVCGMLTIRLKELAEFLDTLLKNKDVLSVVAQDRRKAMRKAIDNSLDLSKSLNNMSLSSTGRFSLTDNSLICSMFDVLNLSSAEANKENRNESNVNQSTIIDNLRAEVKYLKTELEKNVLVKKERSKTIPIDPNSESEAWSEPDRKVSYARIGLDEATIRTNVSRSPKKYQDGMNTSTASENELGKLMRKSSTVKYQDRISELELMLSERQNVLLEQQCHLVETDNRLKEAHLMIIQNNKELETYKQLNSMLEIEIAAFKEKIEQEEHKMDGIRSELYAKEKMIEQIMLDRDSSDVDLRVAGMKLNALQLEHSEMKQSHQDEIDAIMREHSANIEMVKRNLIEKHRIDLNNDWVSRNIFEERMRSFDDMCRRVGESEAIIDYMKDNESELQNQVIENEKAIRALKKNLDDATLQASKAVLERTKIMTDKLNVEKEATELLSQLDGVITEKSELNARMAKLEKSNALMQNRLVSNDMANYQLARSASQGNARYHSMQQLGCAGGYISDDMKQRLENSSPDLGIESDAGRTSGSEQMRATVVTRSNATLGKIFVEGEEENEIPNDKQTFIKNSKKRSNTAAFLSASTVSSQVNNASGHDCDAVDKENMELKLKLKDILAQLKISNSRKEQVERDIRREICKTNNVLKNVRSNIESVEQHQQQQQRLSRPTPTRPTDQNC